MGSSIIVLFSWYDIIYFVDIIILIVLFVFCFVKLNKIVCICVRKVVGVLMFGIVMFFGNLGFVEIDCL